MTEELLKTYEENYINIDRMSIDYAIKNEYPIISLFTPLNAKQAYTVLNKIVSEKLLINFDLCYFLTLLVDAVSCSISNVSIEFGNEPDIYRLLKTILHTVERQFYLTEIGPEKFENLLNIIRRSENRMNQSTFATIMRQITNAFDYNFRGDLKFFQEKQNSFGNLKGYNPVASPVMERPSKPTDISRYFMIKDNFMDKIAKKSADQNENKIKTMIDQDEFIKNNMTVDQDEIIKNKENLDEVSANRNELQPLMGKIFVRSDLVQKNIIPTVQMKHAALYQEQMYHLEISPHF
ncbi:uncharacterized protein LOC123300615 [Chrysoperla carnea]|uniref:uncharacterized protein LOC123300615 n=1 Tax=Chrysoperla carnea TaxID=189513 RepID=UPI001D093709|nr:uncharacterized protein LOC123300615 [Chrysoperla carnea]